MTKCLKLGVETVITKVPRDDKDAVLPAARLVPMPDRIPIWKGIQLDMSHAERFYKYVAKAKDPRADVCLEGEGLGQLYVCFGAPGTGKSFLIRQLLGQMWSGWDTPWGGLLLDPKQTLRQGLVDAPETPEELRKELGTQPTTADEQLKRRVWIIREDNPININLLLSNLGPRDLGVALALAAESAGISTKEPYWLNEMKRIFGAGLALLKVRGTRVTLFQLANLLLMQDPTDPTGKSVLELQIEKARKMDEDELTKELGKDGAWSRNRAVSELDQFSRARGDNADTVRSFISQVLSPFLDPALKYLSDESEGQKTLAELIIREGKWVLIEVPKSALSVSRMLSALAKILFQRAVLDRKLVFPKETRRVFLMVDEYAELASDLPGEGFGDSIFFSQAREFHVLSFIATQGVPMLENSGVREAWKTILSNAAGKLFFRVADPDTADLAAKLLGEGDVVVADKSVVHSPEGGNIQRGEKLERRTVLTSDLFTIGLMRGQFAFLGSTDGKSPASLRFIGGGKNA